MRVFVLTFCAAVLAATTGGRSADAIDFSKMPVNTWVKLSPRDGAPPPRLGWEGSADLDPNSDLWIRHGGHDSNPQGFVLFTWDLRTGQWRQRFPNDSPPGTCCVDGSNVFDVANARFIRFPGGSLGHGWQWSRGVRLKDSAVWAYDPADNTWTNMRPEPYKEPERYSRQIIGSLNSSGTYDPIRGLVLSFGGQTSGGGTDVLHAYDAYSNTLTRLDAANKPSRRDGSGLAYDRDADRLIMFASQYANDEQTWIYDYKTNSWTNHDLTPRPPGRKDERTYATIPRMAYDPVNKISLCVAWLGKGGHETWAFDHAAMKWTHLRPAQDIEESVSRGRNLGFSARHNVFLMQTMSAKNQAQIWAYRYAQPPRATAPPAPSDLLAVTEPGKATLTWKPVPGAKGYTVYRGQGEEAWKVELEKLASTAQPRYEDAPLPSGQVHFYAVRAVGADGAEGPPSFRARTQPRVLVKPVVSVLAADKVEVSWSAHPARDVVGYNVYRGVVAVGTTQKRGTAGKWTDNSPEYPEPVVTMVRDITDIRKLNAAPLAATTLTDTAVDLSAPGPASGDYKYAVYAYIVRAVNRLGVESGPSPYALTIPSAPQHVLLRERGGAAEVKWSANPEKSIAGYLVYKMPSQYSVVEPATPAPIRATAFADRQPGSRARYFIVAVDALGQQGEPSCPVWHGWSYQGFFDGEWHQ